MKSKKKVFLTVLCAKTATVNNTFTVGNVNITLDETDVTPMGVKDTDTKVTENSYKLIPGHTYIKDPTVHVTAGSEESWLFVKVVDEIAAIEDTKTVATQMGENGWIAVAGEAGVYAYNTKVNAGDNIPVFDNFKIKGDAKVSDYAGKTIKVEAYAVQADGFGTAAAAWEAAKAPWTI